MIPNWFHYNKIISLSQIFFKRFVKVEKTMPSLYGNSSTTIVRNRKNYSHNLI